MWRLRPGGEPERIAALPADGLPNGLALNAGTHTLYVTDSVLGTIWSVPTTGGTPTAWSTAPELASAGFLGANGLKIHRGALWATNLDKGTILRIPIRHDGRAGSVRPRPPVCRGSTTSPSPATETSCWPPSTAPARSRWSSPTAATPSC